MASFVPRSCRRGGRSTARIKRARPTGAKAHAFHRLRGSTTSPAPETPSKRRKAVQARGVERNVRTFGNVREMKKTESAADSRSRRNEDKASGGGISPG